MDQHRQRCSAHLCDLELAMRWIDHSVHLEKSRDSRRKIVFPFSHGAFEKVDKLLGLNGTTHEINS